MASLKAPLVQKTSPLFPRSRPRGSSPLASPSAFTTSPLFPRPAPFALPEATTELGVSLGTEPAPAESRRELSSNLQTGFNIVNNYVGIVLLSMSYCCSLAGWLNILMLFVLTTFGAYTGALIVRSYIGCTSAAARSGSPVHM